MSTISKIYYPKSPDMLLFFEVGGVHSPSSWLLLIHKYQILKPQVTESHRVAPWEWS